MGNDCTLVLGFHFPRLHVSQVIASCSLSEFKNGQWQAVDAPVAEPSGLAVGWLPHRPLLMNHVTPFVKAVLRAAQKDAFTFEEGAIDTRTASNSESGES